MGIVWTDVALVTSGSFGIGEVDIEAFDPSGTSLGRIGPLSLGDGNSTGETGEDRFFGVIDLGGISAITIQTSNSVDWEVEGALAPIGVTLSSQVRSALMTDNSLQALIRNEEID